MQRRTLFKLTGAGLVLWHPLTLAAAKQPKPKLIWVLLRGGLDSLHTVMPAFDRDFLSQRRTLNKSILDDGLPLEHGFLLHPQLKTLHHWYRQKQLIPIVAVASQQRTRSHFQAQDILESGMFPIDHDSGWLNRAVQSYQGSALAVSHSTPISLRGNIAAKTWYPSGLPNAEEDLYTRLMGLYQSDALLESRLQEALATREQVKAVASKDKKRRFGDLAAACGKLMASDNGPDCAMLEMGGWDTHNNQPQRLSRQFQELDQGLLKLREQLGQHWDQTVVMVATEFGRTVAENGTGGTDHGTGTAMFLAGGAVAGGRVLGDWPGLGKADQFEGRDLMPTSTIQTWMSSVLDQHWGLSGSQLSQVFPGISPVTDKLIATG